MKQGVFGKVQRIPEKIQELGVVGFTGLVAQRLLFGRGSLPAHVPPPPPPPHPPRPPAPPAHKPLSKFNLFDSCSYIIQEPFGDAYEETEDSKRTINWLIPDFSIGSGGHLNIFRVIQNLENNGFICRIYIMLPVLHQTADIAKAAIARHFLPLKAEIIIGYEKMQPAFISFATSWHTAYPLNQFRGTVHKCYFVQDYEPFFYPQGSEYLWTENTYKFGFRCITAGQWLADKLSSEYGLECDAIGFSYDKERYAPMPRKQDGKKRIFFYARCVTPRRAFEIGLFVLNKVCEHLGNVECILAGWHTDDYHIPFPHQSLGVVALDDLNEIYQQCDTALVLSLTNLSLLPLELMASGCTVVSNRGANVEWGLNDENSVLADLTVESLSEALIAILEDDERREQLRQNGLRYVQQTDWQQEADKVVAVCNQLSNQQ